MNFEFLRTMLPLEAVFYLMIFFGTLLAFEGFRQAVGGRAGEIRHKNRRMRMIAQGADENRIAEVLFRNRSTGDKRTNGPIAKFRRALAHARFSW